MMVQYILPQLLDETKSKDMNDFKQNLSEHKRVYSCRRLSSLQGLFEKDAAKRGHLESRTVPCLVHADKTRGLHGLTCQKHQKPTMARGTRLHM